MYPTIVFHTSFAQAFEAAFPANLNLRHFDLYLEPIKATILEGAAAKEILDMGGADRDMDEDEVDEGFNIQAEGVSTTAGGQVRGGIPSRGAAARGDERRRGTLRSSHGLGKDPLGMPHKRRSPLEVFRVR